MSERQNNYDSLEPGQLREPPAIFWPGYFWAKHGVDQPRGDYVSHNRAERQRPIRDRDQGGIFF